MRILQFIDSLNSGGAERMAVNIANALHDRGIAVELCSSRYGGALQSQLHYDIPVTILNKQSRFDPRAFRRFLSLIRKHKITHIHAHSTSIFMSFCAKCFYPELKLIWHDHYSNRAKVNYNYNSLIRLFSYYFSAVICVSEELYLWSINNLKLKKTKILLLPNFPNLQLKPDSLRSNSLILCLANIRKEKGHDTLIKASAILKDRRIPFQLQLAGALTDYSHVRKIRKLVAELQLEEHVHFLGAVDDPSTCLSQAQIGVLASNAEGLPVALLEYGLAGLAVVTTDVGESAEVLMQGQLGEIVRARDPLAMADALEILLKSPEYAQSQGLALQAHVLEHYSADNFIRPYLALLAGS